MVFLFFFRKDGISYDDVDKVEILEGENMDKGYPLRHTMIDIMVDTKE